MGFLGGAGMAGAAGGANQALQNYLQFYMQNKELEQKKAQEDARLAEQARQQKAQEGYHTGMMGIAQSREDREGAEMRQMAEQQLREQMSVQPMPQLPVGPQGPMTGPAAYPETPQPMSFTDKLDAFTKVNPQRGLSLAAGLQQNTQQRSVKIIYGPDDKTKVIFVDQDTELPEGWSFEKPSQPKSPSAFSTFYSGYSAQLKKQHPDWTQNQIDMAVSDEAERRGIEKSVKVSVAAETAKGAAQSNMLSTPYKEQAYQYLKTTGELPTEMHRLFRLPYAQADLMNYVGQRQEEEGVSGVDRALNKAFYAGGVTSMRMQEKTRGMMGGFVRNIDKQVGRVDEIIQDISRTGIRALDLPIRELKVRAVGSGYEKNIEAYLIEISSEISKLSSGSAASIAQLPVETQKMWNKIHDPNLSLGELKKVLAETRRMANMRMESVTEEIEFSKGRIKEGATPQTKTIVERRTTKSGKTLVKYSDGTIGEE